MILGRKTPCHECPWRIGSPQGYLGGHPPEMYADAVDNNEVPACHLRDNGPNSRMTDMCAGALATMANQCKSACNTEGGEDARRIVGRRSDCFAHVADFYEYHAGKKYVNYVMRQMQKGKSKQPKALDKSK